MKPKQAQSFCLSPLLLTTRTINRALQKSLLPHHCLHSDTATVPSRSAAPPESFSPMALQAMAPGHNEQQMLGHLAGWVQACPEEGWSSNVIQYRLHWHWIHRPFPTSSSTVFAGRSTCPTQFSPCVGSEVLEQASGNVFFSHVLTAPK